MQYQISSDNMEMTPSMESLAKQKFSRIENRIKHVPEGSKSARIVMNTAPTEMFQVRVNLNINGKDYFSDETDYTLESALIKTVEELVVMMEKDMDYSKEGAQITAEDLMKAELAQDDLTDDGTDA
jgi:ribosome-associated translation inhibitor RaiA